MDRPKAADRDKIAAARAILMAAPALLQQQASQQTAPNEADELAPDLDTLKARILSRPLDPDPDPDPNWTAYCGTKLEEPTWVARKVPFLPASGVLCPSCLRSYRAALRHKTNPSTVEEPNNDE